MTEFEQAAVAVEKILHDLDPYCPAVVRAEVARKIVHAVATAFEIPIGRAPASSGSPASGLQDAMRSVDERFRRRVLVVIREHEQDLVRRSRLCPEGQHFAEPGADACRCGRYAAVRQG